jgi:hypothetical protein
MQFKYFSFPPTLSTLEVIARNLPGTVTVRSRKSGECPYRYKPSSAYYARIKRNGKEIRQTSRLSGVEAGRTYRRVRYDKRSKGKRGTENPRISHCEAATDFNVAQAYADAAETYAGSQPNALTSVLGLQQRIVGAEAVGVWV